MSSRLVRRLASWIALVALLAVTFMPAVTSALAATQVCSADAPSPSTPTDGQHPFDHCHYCALHADLAAPPAPAQSADAAPVRFRALPLAFFRAPHATAVWSTSQPRAPPVLA